jgi:hypothetical protein
MRVADGTVHAVKRPTNLAMIMMGDVGARSVVMMVMNSGGRAVMTGHGSGLRHGDREDRQGERNNDRNDRSHPLQDLHGSIPISVTSSRFRQVHGGR